MSHKIIFFMILLLFFLVDVQGDTTIVKFDTSPEDKITAGETISIAGSVSASADVVCIVYGVIRHKKDSNWEDVIILVNDTIALSPGETKNYKREWSTPPDAEPGEYGFYVRTIINGTRDSWSYPKFRIIKDESKNDTFIPPKTQAEINENGKENKTENEEHLDSMIMNNTNVQNDTDSNSIYDEKIYEIENKTDNKSENESGLSAYTADEVLSVQKDRPLPFIDISIILILFIAVILFAIYRDIF